MNVSQESNPYLKYQQMAADDLEGLQRAYQDPKQREIVQRALLNKQWSETHKSIADKAWSVLVHNTEEREEIAKLFQRTVPGVQPLPVMPNHPVDTPSPPSTPLDAAVLVLNSQTDALEMGSHAKEFGIECQDDIDTQFFSRAGFEVPTILASCLGENPRSEDLKQASIVLHSLFFAMDDFKDGYKEEIEAEIAEIQARREPEVLVVRAELKQSLDDTIQQLKALEDVLKKDLVQGPKPRSWWQGLTSNPFTVEEERRTDQAKCHQEYEKIRQLVTQMREFAEEKRTQLEQESSKGMVIEGSLSVFLRTEVLEKWRQQPISPPFRALVRRQDTYAQELRDLDNEALQESRKRRALYFYTALEILSAVRTTTQMFAYHPPAPMQQTVDPQVEKEASFAWKSASGSQFARVGTRYH